MRQPGHGQQGDHRAVVGQGVHAAAGHGGDAVHDFQRDIGGVGGGDEAVGHSRQRDAHTTRCRAGDAGEQSDRHGLIDQRIGDALERIREDQEAWQRRDHRPETVFRRGIHRRQQRATDRCLGALGELFANDPEGADQYQQNPQQQGGLHCPDGGEFADVGLQWRRHAG